MSALYRLSRLEYERAVDAGVFEPDARLELADGTLVTRARETPRHATGSGHMESFLRHAFDSGYYVRVKHPLAADDYSEPEPDLAVVSGGMRDYVDGHPTTAVLVVEIADGTPQHERTVKQRLYARCGIPECWILALAEARLEVYGDPTEDGYLTVTGRGADGGRSAHALSGPGRIDVGSQHHG